MNIEFKASKFRISEDHEGEIKLTLLVPQSDAGKVYLIPVLQELTVSIEVVSE